jgi:aminopeptidase-like protein
MKFTNEIEEMDKLFDRLFPILRSITGEGLRESFDILKEYIPLEIYGVKTDTQVFDWTIPKEWVIREAWIKDSEGNKVIDIADSNLHVVNYSTAIDAHLNLEELKKHVHTIPHLPEAVPYVISYYKERWGFCMSQYQLDSLKEGDYHVYIDSEHIHGELNYAHAILPGKSTKEILISTYICHPSMANNELSGPIVAAFLYNRLKNWKERELTYRFVFIPETIGSITYLHEHGKHLKENLYSGMVLTCLGGESLPLSYKNSKVSDSPLNNLVSYLVEKEQRDIETRPFSPLNGSDERQYCSPGFNLPVGQFSRMVYGQYDGYHNSLDTKENMTIEALLKSVDDLEEILRLQELNGYYINQKPFGEPKLGNYDLYPDLNSPVNRSHSANEKMDNRQQLNQVLMLLNYSDGETRLDKIVNHLNYKIEDYKVSIDILKENKLLKGPFYEKRGLFE